MSRIAARFAELKRQRRAGLVTFVTAGDPDETSSRRLLAGLPEAGADLIELGMPFTDPMADGPAIQASSLRALKSGMTLSRTLAMVEEFRRRDSATPLVLMGYYNPIYRRGPERFAREAADAGVDGLIVVDLPAEESAELAGPARECGLDLIPLVAPTTDDSRLPKVLSGSSGFVYYVAIAGITGTKSAKARDLEGAVARIRRVSDLPVAVGFGIRTPAQAEEIAHFADGCVVGSALVDRIAANLDHQNRAEPELVEAALDFVRDLARGVGRARVETVGQEAG